MAVLTLAIPVDGQERFTLEHVAFLSGCWTGRGESVELREHWSEAEGAVMLGTTRFLRGGAVVDWEFARIFEDSDGVTLWPYPRGVASEHGFRLVRAEGERVFENLEHDYPVRIIYAYRHGEPGRVEVRIEGADGEAQGWSLARSPCPPGP